MSSGSMPPAPPRSHGRLTRVGAKSSGTRFVLITMADRRGGNHSGARGWRFDIGKEFITKNETQAFCDAAALAATLKPGSELPPASPNLKLPSPHRPTREFRHDDHRYSRDHFRGPASPVPGFQSEPSTGYIFYSCTRDRSSTMYFMPIIVPQFTQNVASAATAGQIAITSFPRGLAPYTAGQYQYGRAELWAYGRRLLRHPMAAVQQHARGLRSRQSGQMLCFGGLHWRFHCFESGGGDKLGSQHQWLLGRQFQQYY
jgi:hypothetical protein